MIGERLAGRELSSVWSGTVDTDIADATEESSEMLSGRSGRRGQVADSCAVRMASRVVVASTTMPIARPATRAPSVA